MRYPWSSIEEMNKVDNVANMHGIFAALFMSFVGIWKFLLPELKFVMLTSSSKELNPSIETIEIEKSPSKYSESFEATYIVIREESTIMYPKFILAYHNYRQC